MPESSKLCGMDYEDLIARAQRHRDVLRHQVQLVEKLIEIATALARQESSGENVVHALLDSSTSATRQHTAEILSALGRPVKTAELLELLIERGVAIAGKNPLGTLSARLSNSNEFRSLGPIGWWFRDKPVPRRSSRQTNLALEKLRAIESGRTEGEPM